MKKLFLTMIVAVAIGFISATALCVDALKAQTVSVFSKEGMRIVIDAGHGGIDAGVVGTTTGAKESDVNLEIAALLKDALSDNGFEVVLTRKTSGGLYGTTAKGFKKRDMQKRKEIIEEARPDLILSVHQNFYPSKRERGGQVFYGKGLAESQKLALPLQAQLNELYAEEGVKNRRVKEGEFFMLECYPCPSVIVECGFLSNAADEGILTTVVGRKRLVSALVAGVLDYFSQNTQGSLA